MGIDLGGTKTEIIALDHEGIELYRKRVKTPSYEYQAVIGCIVELIRDAEKIFHIKKSLSIGIGTPGAISPATGLQKNSNTVCLNGKPFKIDLEKALGRPVKMANDANCFALSEAIDGAGEGGDIVFGVILGTGVGGGIVVNKKVLTGINAISGEWGHNPLPWPEDQERPGPSCYCGRAGCIETFLSGPAMERFFCEKSGQKLKTKEVIEKAKVGDLPAMEILNAYEHRLAKSLAHIINILDPSVIVLGGGMSNVESLYEKVPLLWGKYVFSDEVATKLVKAKYGDSSGVRGAAWL